MLVAFIGVSSVGKSTIMNSLRRARHFQYVRNVTTRHARYGEYHKSTISEQEFAGMRARGELSLINSFFDNQYAYLKADVDLAIASSAVYMIDFGIENISQLFELQNTIRVILMPESEEMLAHNVEKAQRGRNIDIVLRDYRDKYKGITEGYSQALRSFVVTNRLGKVGTAAYHVAEHVSSQTGSNSPGSNQGERLKYILDNIDMNEPARNALEAYKIITQAIDEFEDNFSAEPWSPPRTYMDGSRSSRMYTIFPESFHDVPEYRGVTLLLSLRELIFISKNGAIEVQVKDTHDPLGERKHFKDRKHNVLFSKVDIEGNDVWHASNI
jgi:guanylate kinase